MKQSTGKSKVFVANAYKQAKLPLSMALALSGELNLFRESVPVVPDAVLLPCWLQSHYYPLLFQEAVGRRWAPWQRLYTRSGVMFAVIVKSRLFHNGTLGKTDFVMFVCVCVWTCRCVSDAVIITKPWSPELISYSVNITVVSSQPAAVLWSPSVEKNIRRFKFWPGLTRLLHMGIHN